MHNAAIFLSALLLVYHQVTTWGPFYPWNDVAKYSKKELTLEAGINGILMGTALICITFSTSSFTHWFPLIYYPFLLVGECVDWWIPYFSDSFAKARSIWDYDAHFSRTIKWIPHQQGKRTPDANHIVLHGLTVLTIIVVFLDRLQIGR